VTYIVFVLQRIQSLIIGLALLGSEKKRRARGLRELRHRVCWRGNANKETT